MWELARTIWEACRRKKTPDEESTAETTTTDTSSNIAQTSGREQTPFSPNEDEGESSGESDRKPDNAPDAAVASASTSAASSSSPSVALAAALSAPEGDGASDHDSAKHETPSCFTRFRKWASSVGNRLRRKKESASTALAAPLLAAHDEDEIPGSPSGASGNTLPQVQPPPAPSCFEKFKAVMRWVGSKANVGRKRAWAAMHWTGLHFIYPLLAPYSYIFRVSQVALSIGAQFIQLLVPLAFRSLTHILAGFWIVMALALIGSIEAILGIIRSFRGHRIYHNNPFSEFWETWTNFCLFQLIFTVNPLTTTYGWSLTIGLLATILNTFGPQANGGSVHLNTLPFLYGFRKRNAASYFSAFQRLFHVLLVFFNALVTNVRLVSYLIGIKYGEDWAQQNHPYLSALRWIIGGGWASLFTFSAVSLVRLLQNRRSFLDLHQHPLFRFSVAMVGIHIFKACLWVYYISTIQLHDSVEVLKILLFNCLNCLPFKLGNNITAIATVIFSILLALLCSLEGMSLYRRQVAESNQASLPPPKGEITAADMTQAAAQASHLKSLGFFGSRRATDTIPSDAPSFLERVFCCRRAPAPMH